MLSYFQRSDALGVQDDILKRTVASSGIFEESEYEETPNITMGDFFGRDPSPCVKPNADFSSYSITYCLIKIPI